MRPSKLTMSLLQLCCLQSKSVKELIKAHSQTPALLDPNTNGGLLATVLGIDLPNITSLDSSVLDGEIIKHQPLSVGSKVPIIIGQSKPANNPSNKTKHITHKH